MNVSNLKNAIMNLNEIDVFIETELDGKRSCQSLCDVLIGTDRIILVSKEALDADPINGIPSVPVNSDLKIIQ